MYTDETEVRGTARLAEALQAHVWPDITLKCGDAPVSSIPFAKTLPSPSKELISEDDRLLSEGLDGKQDPGGESFEQLFAKFADMKGKKLYSMNEHTLNN
jgi:hypothetical protein